MINKFEKYTELYNDSVLSYMEKCYKYSFRKDWFISEMVWMPREEKWLIKWKRK
jgi:hypothetical protein